MIELLHPPKASTTHEKRGKIVVSGCEDMFKLSLLKYKITKDLFLSFSAVKNKIVQLVLIVIIVLYS